MLTGERQTGKTSLCGRISGATAASGLDVAGVLSPALFSGAEKTGIEAVDLRSGRTRHIAGVRAKANPEDLGYEFDEEGLSWADSVLASATPCDLLVIDELGPLEIEMDRGMCSAFGVLRHQQYRVALVVVRPELVDAFLAKLGLPCTVRTVDELENLTRAIWQGLWSSAGRGNSHV